MADRVYPLAAFRKAAASPAAAIQQPHAVPLGVGRIDDLDILIPYGVPERVRVIIGQGHHPEEPAKPSRSEWLYDVLCNLRRRNVPDNITYSLITDKGYGISASVLDKGANVEKYALRQMERAKLEVSRERASFSLTDVGNGERIAAQHGEDMRYCYAWKGWMAWDGMRFRQDDSGEAHRRAKQTAASIYEEAARIAAGNPDKAKHVAKWAAASQSRRSIEAALVMAQSELPVRTDDLDSDDDLLNLKSGTIDLRTLTHRDHSRDDLITKLAPVVFDPAATCPLWLKFLNRIYDGDQDLIAFIQRAVGYSLTGDISEQVLFLMHGGGKNGKSTMLDTLLALLGDYARPTEFRALLAKDNSDAVRNDIAALVGLRLVTAIEVGHSKRLDEAVVKQLTGGDKITARFLHKEFFDFYPKFKLFLAANHRPEIRGVDEAIWRRVLLIPHEVTIPESERDKNLPTKLTGELPGILNWALDGLRVWRADGLMPPLVVRQATAEYRSEMDLIGEFLAMECRVEKTAYDIHEETSDLYARYEYWCGQNGEQPVTKRTFGKVMKERGFRDGHEGGKRVKYGVKLLTAEERRALSKPKEKQPF